ncbi:cell division protein FtsK [Oceanobacillus oncorhynchi subsp. incaldanensis]|uniref:FtsK/SpoIIIE domain-containing protein n=1 Tax=Oceanobacillus oncorhynchi TaxID=545501 RepID=UPI001B12F9E0|nr:FtsK/SpoIIIE domain-containing protein [Oceanobacillus oncorhynchi]GIO18457.1 cell division protein FtsK [Oceanobacillus oncorhynchi subsp. incaldanensis]HIS29524.1 DNA translocase FtsK [Candidatus Avamphibacillus intestinigallinarum]HLR22833.1 FtsK/SpoIIIE domain-containing protein [Pseudogracilibacillus sp.]
MKLFKKRGKRIKEKDASLVFQFVFTRLVGTWLLFFTPFHLSFLLSTEWQLDTFQAHFISTYGLMTLLISLVLTGGCAFVYYRYRYDHLKQVIHRQKLAKMVLENGWYETKQVTKESFFKDIPSDKAKEKISHFPKIYYRFEKGLLYIQVEITLGKFQEPLLNLETRLESGLYCELVSKELRDSYVEYTLFYDMIANRISIDEVIAQDGSLKLMESFYWEYDKLPHMLIAGGTGGGKSYFILTLIEALLKTDAKLYVLDPKNADLADLSAVMPDVYYKQEDMTACIDQFYEDMMRRNEEMKTMPNYKTGENYAYLGLPARFLIFDEYTSFMEMIGKESVKVMSKLKQIVMLGRQSGFFLVLACQRPDAKYLGDGIRDNFNFRVALGRMSELGYGMVFGSDVQKQFFLKPIKGRGYVDNGDSVISEFYTPLVPKGHDFLKEIRKLAN